MTPTNGNRHLIQYPTIPDGLMAKATMHSIEFDKVWEGRYRRYINETNWWLSVHQYVPS